MDIVERLREKAERKSPNLYRKQQRIETEAADEIERLREALRLMPKTITDAADEIKRLRYALQWIASCEGGDVYEIWKEMQKTAKAALKEGEKDGKKL